MKERILALKDSVMDNNRPSTASERARQSFPQKLPPIQTRRAACTHMTVDRLFGNHTCNHCGRVPRLGWVYRCTQDHGSQLPPEENTDPQMPIISPGKAEIRDTGASFVGIEDAVTNEEAESSTNFIQLKPWMLKAIIDGWYSSQHVAILQAQRQNVKETIGSVERGIRDHFVHPTTSGTPMTSFDPTIPLTTISTADHSIASNTTSRMFPNCTYKACSCCR